MDTSKLKKFAQFARRTLIGQVSAKLALVMAEGGRRSFRHARPDSPPVVGGTVGGATTSVSENIAGKEHGERRRATVADRR